VTALIVTVVNGGRTPDMAGTLAYWGHRVLYVGGPADLSERSRLGTARAVVQVWTSADPERLDEFEQIRDGWLADYDVVLIDGTYFDPGPDSPLCYRVPDLVILTCRLDNAGVRDARRTVERWQYLRNLLPLDRSQLLVVPWLEPGDSSASPSVLDAVGQLCRNWSETSVPIADVLRLLAGSSVSPLAALIAHRLARTDLLVSNPRGFIAAARRNHLSDVIVVRDERYQRLATQLENSLRALGLRVPELPDGTTGAVCVLAGPEDTAVQASYVRGLTVWDHPSGPLPLIITRQIVTLLGR
jgi:hypothetical protein